MSHYHIEEIQMNQDYVHLDREQLVTMLSNYGRLNATLRDQLMQAGHEITRLRQINEQFRWFNEQLMKQIHNISSHLQQNITSLNMTHTAVMSALGAHVNQPHYPNEFNPFQTPFQHPMQQYGVAGNNPRGMSGFMGQPPRFNDGTNPNPENQNTQSGTPTDSTESNE